VSTASLKEYVMRRLLVAASALLAVAAPSFGAPEVEEPSWISGRLERFDPGSGDLVIREGTRALYFSVTGDVRFIQGGRPVDPRTLATDVGQDVRVRFLTDAIGHHADRVDLVTDEARGARPGGHPAGR
jgi:hypothetical protein